MAGHHKAQGWGGLTSAMSLGALLSVERGQFAVNFGIQGMFHGCLSFWGFLNLTR